MTFTLLGILTIFYWKEWILDMKAEDFITEYNGLRVFQKRQGEITYKFEFEEFFNISFKNADLQNAMFRHCTFHNCYFREADLSNASLSGSSFFNCSFKEAKFANNMMENTTFTACEMNEKKAFKAVVKTKQHPTARLAKNLRINAFELRKSKAFFYMFRQEKIYMRKHHLQYILPTKNQYYKSRRNINHFFGSFWYLVKDMSSRLFWWYGYGIFNMLVIAFLIISIFALFYHNMGLAFSNAIVISISSFSTLGFVGNDLYDAVSSTVNQVMVLESLSGAIYIALLASVIYSRYAKVH